MYDIDMSNITPTLNEEELELVISSLLFSSSVNVVSNTEEYYQKRLLDVAIKLKKLKPDISLSHIQFIKEDNYEDQWSCDILENFSDNIEIVGFEHI